jgi:hypothetical protein
VRSRASGRYEHSDPAANEFIGESSQAIWLILGPAVFDRKILALYIAGLLETLAKRAHALCPILRRSRIEVPNHGRSHLLRPRAAAAAAAAEKSDERAASHMKLIQLPHRRRQQREREGGTSAGGLHIDYQLDFRGLLDGQVSQLFALEDAPGIDADQRYPSVTAASVLINPPAAANSRQWAIVGPRGGRQRDELLAPASQNASPPITSAQRLDQGREG